MPILIERLQHKDPASGSFMKMTVGSIRKGCIMLRILCGTGWTSALAVALLFSTTNASFAQGSVGGKFGGYYQSLRYDVSSSSFGQGGGGGKFGASTAPRYTAAPVQSIMASSPAEQPAYLTVQLPDPNASVLFDGAKTMSTGSVRRFESPPLSQGDYTYRITASWMENGKMTTKTREVHVAPGVQSVVNFPES
jgi:uncharacterized protein (TIGR03000 family)